MANAYLGAGIAQGAANVQQYVREQPERDARLAEAKAKQNMAEAQWNEYNANSDLRQSQKDLQMQQLQNDVYTAQSEGLRARTFSSFGAYEGDKNTKHLNNFLQDARKNPLGQRMYGGWLRVDPVVRSPETDKLLRQAGVMDTEDFYRNQESPDEETATNFVIGTTASGGKALMDMDQLYAASGYTQYMGDQELERLSKRALATSRLRQGTSLQRQTETQKLVGLLMEENPSLTSQEAYEQAVDILKPQRSGFGSETERVAKEIAEKEGIPYVEAYERAVSKKKGATTAQRETDEAITTRAELDEAFNGEFFNTDFSKLENRRKAVDQVTRLEKENPISTEDKRVTRQIRQLSALGQTAGEEIGDEEAGLIDSMFRGVKKYISNEVEGTKGTAAYEQFRNVMRNALYGATLSPNESKAFQKAMGSLAEQKGPVLAKLRTQLEDLKTQLQSVASFGDPHVSHYYLGMDQDQIEDAIFALDERLELFEEPTPQGPGTIKAKKEIGDYFNRGTK